MQNTAAALLKKRCGGFLYEHILGLAAQDNLDRNILKVVKKVPHRFRVRTEGLAQQCPGVSPMDTHQPFFEGLDPKIY